MKKRAALELEALFDRIASFIAWRLPRRVVYWAYIRVAADGYPGTPDEHLPVETAHRKEHS